MTGRLYTIKEAALHTGLSTQLIRKWEERYGAIRPERLSNGYRGYSASDIATIRHLKSRVDEGVPIGMAVKELEESGGVSAAFGARRLLIGDTAHLPVTGPSEANWREPIARLLDAFEQLDAIGAQQVYEQLLATHHLEHVLMQVLHPALVELGERWERGVISEYQEHFGSHFIRDKMLSLRSLFRPGPHSPLLVTACGPGERHELGILFAGFFAMQAGYQVVYLGPSPAEKGMLDCVRDKRPLGLLLGYSQKVRLEESMPFLRELDAIIADESPATSVFIGGRAVKTDGVLPGTKGIRLLAGDAKAALQKMSAQLGTAES